MSVCSQRSCVLHGLGSQNTVEMVYLISLIRALGPVEDHTALHRGQDDKCFRVKLFPEIRKYIVL